MQALATFIFSPKTAAKWAAPIGLAMAAMAGNPAAAQVVSEEPDAEEIARTPLNDLNINPEDIPEILVAAAKNPYASDGLSSCNAIVAQVAELDTVLGPDYDIVGEADTGLSVGKAAKGVVGSVIPFRGLLREVSGAAGDERKANAAIAAGMVRRGFLKGLGQERGCDYPASPRPATAQSDE